LEVLRIQPLSEDNELDVRPSLAQGTQGRARPCRPAVAVYEDDLGLDMLAQIKCFSAAVGPRDHIQFIKAR
jgi:hypothetical protein